MTEEIKEILYKFDKVLENYELDKKTKSFSVDSICHLFPNEMITIKNYITNLQKENTNLKKLCDKYEEEHNTAFKLWKANMEKIPPFDKFLDYKQRNEKAIEWCKCVVNAKYTSDKLPNGKITDMGYCLDLAEPLLNILQGGDE